VLQKLSVDECLQVLKRGQALYLAEAAEGETRQALNDDLLRFLANAADGDARVALSTLDLALKSDGELSEEELKKSLVKAHLQYDRTGDQVRDKIRLTMGR
jgi:putative ATPase